MPNAILSEEEKYNILYHLGYLVANPTGSIQLGVPAASQPQFLVNTQMERIPQPAIGRVRSILSELEDIERQLSEARKRMRAAKLGEITLRQAGESATVETDALEHEYDRWGNRLANILGCPYYPYAKRYQNGGLPPLMLRRAQI